MSPDDECSLCNKKRSVHGVAQMCPPFDKNWNIFRARGTNVEMKATDLVNAFEQEWLPKYPDIRHFTVDAVVTDIAYWRKVAILAENRLSLVTFLCKYLKEHPDRFQYGGMNGFRVVANMPGVKKFQESPN